MRLEAALRRIEHRKLDAIVSRQAAHKNLRNALPLEPFAEAGGFAMAVVEQSAVAVDARVGPLLEYFRDAVLLQRGRKRRARGVLDAMNRPQRLRQTIEFNLL